MFGVDGQQTQLDLSTVGYGTFIGKPDDEDDFDSYVALKYLIKSGAINHIDTAQNFRCQKSERTVGNVLKTLLDSEFGEFENEAGFKYQVQRDEVFVTTKNGYVPEDADNGIPSAVLVEQLVDASKISKEDVVGGIHCMHPSFLEHQLRQS